jgi:two-component system sensor histidine kinase KdpD
MTATEEPKTARGTIRSRVTSFSGMKRQRQGRRMAGYAVAVVGMAILLIALLPTQYTLSPLSKGFGFLVVVVIASAIGGLGPGLLASVLGFLVFNFFFLPPQGTFVIHGGEYIVVLFVFLGLSVLVAALLARAAERAETAEAREAELATLQGLSATLATLVPGPASYGAMVEAVLAAFGCSIGALFVRSPDDQGLTEVVTIGTEPGILSPSWRPGEPLAWVDRVPLTVGGRTLGLLALAGDRDPLASAESRVLRTFCDQFAIALERDRLLQAATDTEVMRQTEHLRRSLVAAVSHDLRSPLAAIKASVTDLLDQQAQREPAETWEALESIDNETDRLDGLIANLLDMSRIEGGILRPRLETVDLDEAAAVSIDRAGQRWPGRSFVCHAPGPEPALVRADPVFLERILANLLDNAAEATGPSGPSVEVKVSVGPHATVRVIDHGSGVPTHVHEQLFFPFYRLSERHPRLGTGLGLAIVKGFLDLMDGEVWIEQTPGGGATFCCQLPSATGAS